MAGGLNLYAYVGNSPIGASGPSGLKPEDRMADAGNFFGGFAHHLGGTGLGFGPNLYDMFIVMTPGGDVISPSSGWYKAGDFAGFVWGMALGGLLAGAAAQVAVLAVKLLAQQTAR